MKELLLSIIPLPQDAAEHQKEEVVLSTSVESIIRTRTVNGGENNAFFVANLAEVSAQLGKWKRLLPRVAPFYAVKCNPDAAVVKLLADSGVSFDCASKSEIDLVLANNVPPARIIYANPCKQASHIRHAAAKGVNLFTFDNADELLKMKQTAPNANMVLRILTDDSRSVCKFGIKFGAHISLVPALLKTAKELSINVVGISFHVGSGCYDPSAFADAVILARKAFDIASTLGFELSLLDIGGGFPGRSPTGIQFEDIVAHLRPALDEHFPHPIRIIAEPGRYFVSSAYTLAVNILARRVIPSAVKAAINSTEMEISASENSSLDSPQSASISGDTIDADASSITSSASSTPIDTSDPPSFMYYINDGMYGSFNCIMFDHVKVFPRPLIHNNKFLYASSIPQSTPLYPCSIWGPTCDSIDCISRHEMLPEMQVGDWLVFDNMGAYTVAAASDFNGFKKSEVMYTESVL